jgi:hypothetical protein
MAKGPRGEKRPADVIGTAIMVGRIATGDVVDKKRDKNPHAVALGKLGGEKGGAARASSLSAKERTIAAKKAATARWRDSAGNGNPSHGLPSSPKGFAKTPNRKHK